MDDTPITDEELWDLIESEEVEEGAAPRPRWRRTALIAVAAVTALAMAVVPLYNLFGTGRTVSHNGLEVCGIDYCVVQDAIVSADMVGVASRLSNELLADEDAKTLADEIAAHLDLEPVTLTVVDRLDDGLGGVYMPSSREILIRRPARAWTVAHEMAHVVSTGHGDDFIEALLDIAAWLDSRGQR